MSQSRLHTAPETFRHIWPSRRACAVVLLALYTPLAAAHARSAQFIAPAEIDRAVSAFTGAEIGSAGGALAPADARLRLAPCVLPLATSWHGNRRTAVRVECPQTRGGSGPWHIFVATRPSASGASFAAPAAARVRPAMPAVKRGDTVTVMVRGSGFSVQHSGEAMQNGQIGDWIGIRTARRADPVHARIERPGLAVIPLN